MFRAMPTKEFNGCYVTFELFIHLRNDNSMIHIYFGNVFNLCKLIFPSKLLSYAGQDQSVTFIDLVSMGCLILSLAF